VNPTKTPKPDDEVQDELRGRERLDAQDLHRPSVLIPDGFNDSPACENHRAERLFTGIEQDRVDARVHIVLFPSSRLPCTTRRR